MDPREEILVPGTKRGRDSWYPCQYFTQCGESVSRSSQAHPPFTCFSCKIRRQKLASKKQYARIKQARRRKV